MRRIAACGAGRVDEGKRRGCFAKRLPAQRRYSRLVAETQAMVDGIVLQWNCIVLMRFRWVAPALHGGYR